MLNEVFVEEDKPNIPIDKEKEIITILKVVRSIFDGVLSTAGSALIIGTI